jgi:RNA polymerase sigma-70 factor (ECF subfamily)
MDQTARWIDDARAGSAAAFDRLVDEHLDTVYRAAFYQHGGDEHHAAELCREALRSARAGLGTYHGGAEGFAGWLLGLLVATSRDAPGAGPAVSDTGEGRPAAAAPAPPLPAPGQTPADYAAAEGLDALMVWALAQLPEDHRWPLVLDGCGLDYAAIAQALGLDPPALRSRLARARLQLADVLAGDAAVREPGP